MSSDTPEGQPPAAADEWPAELVPPPPPEATAVQGAPAPGASDEATVTRWDVPAAPAIPAAAVPAPAPVQQATAGWGSVPPSAPGAIQPPQWDVPATPPPAAGGWGTMPASGEPSAPLSAPPSAPPSGQWGAPPPQAGGWGPVPGTPGAPPPGAWNPQPAQSGNGCLKACLIVGAILIIVGIIGIIGLVVVSMRVAGDLGVNSDGSMKACELITNDALGAALGSEAQALPIVGLGDITVGQVLDRRALPDAPDCWIVSSSATSLTGRLARQDGGDASGDFQRARQGAEAGGYFAGDASGVGDEAFCTGMSATGSFGILVRIGGNLAYVSLFDPATMESRDFQTDSNGVIVSPETCAQAGAVALAMLR
jgi:hypothetical protein